MSKNCVSCRYRGEARTPRCSKKPEHAATCEYPIPNLVMIHFNVTDVARHINLATILPGSPFYNEDHAKIECDTWEKRP